MSRIKLYQFHTAFGLPNLSPFCMKVETYLRMAKLDFEIVEIGDPRSMPKGKAPVIEDQGNTIADSSFILEYLEDTYHPDFDAGLSPEDRATAHAFARLLEERFYFLTLYSRWMDDRCWPTVRSVFFDALPPVIRTIIPVVARRQVRKNLFGQGTGRHTQDEIYRMAVDDLDQVSGFLGDKPYFLGDTPRTIDTIVYSVVANAAGFPVETPIRESALSHTNLMEYCDRMKAGFYQS